MTWIMLGAAAISAAGAVGSAALSKRGGGGAPGAIMQPEQKTAPIKPTAENFKVPPSTPLPPQQVQAPQLATSQMPPTFVSQSVPENAQLSDFLKILQRGEY